MNITDDLLSMHHALVRSDNPWHREARLRQALWREQAGLEMGLLDGRPLGWRLRMPFARRSLANYMTDTIRDVVWFEVLDRERSANKLYDAPRIFENLLSSQPLCFNLFAELQQDLGLASRTFALLLGDPSLVVKAMEFEYSPGRSEPRFTDDKSAFDVFVEYTSATAKRAFLGIEVKYHENLKQKPARHRARYDEVAEQMGCFDAEPASRRRLGQLQQLWRDHLLAGSHLARWVLRVHTRRVLRALPGAQFDGGLRAGAIPKLPRGQQDLRGLDAGASARRDRRCGRGTVGSRCSGSVPG